MTVAPAQGPPVVTADPADPPGRPPRDEPATRLLDADATGPARRVGTGGDVADPEDLATWFAYYLFGLLVALLALGGFWISIFAL